MPVAADVDGERAEVLRSFRGRSLLRRSGVFWTDRLAAGLAHV